MNSLNSTQIKRKMESELYNRINKLYDEGITRLNFVTETGEIVKARLGKTGDGQLLEMIGKSRRGFYLKDDRRYKDFKLIKTRAVSVSVKWEKSLKKALSMLNKSGLWASVKTEIELALSIGWETLQQVNKIERTDYCSNDFNKNVRLRVEEVKKICPQLIKISEGKEYIDYNILWHYSQPLKIKKMYFGKYINEEKLQQIKESLIKKENITINTRTNYDIRFKYLSESSCAWYSEEFKNCGNGHYYLALNETHVMHYEDD